jgi:hypothetical protein
MIVDEDRPISEREAELVTWLLKNGATRGSLQHLAEGVGSLRVVGRCGCGCASVDFEQNGRNCVRSHPIAEAYGATPTGLKFGLILWGRDEAVTGLEIYEGHPGSATTLPSPEVLSPSP